MSYDPWAETVAARYGTAASATVVEEPTAAVDAAEDEEPWFVCCPDPITAARRLCGCGGHPYH